MIEMLVPFYGPPEQLFDLVRSAQAQTSPDWRLLVVDDAWPGEPVKPWLTAMDDPRIDYRRNETNLGVNGNFQRCLDLATGDHVTFPGGDDLLLPSYVERLLEVLEEFPDAVVVQPGVEVIDDEGAVVTPLVDRVKRRLAPQTDRATEYSGEHVLASLFRGNWAYFPSICWRREKVAAIGFDPSYDVVMDLALLVRVLQGGGNLVVDPVVTFRYRRHLASYSSLRAIDGDRFADERAFYDATARALENAGMPKAARAARQHLTSRLHALSLLPTAARAGQRATMLKLVGHAAGLRPSRRPTE